MLAIQLFPAYFAASKNGFFSEKSLFLCKRNEETHHWPVIASRGAMLLPKMADASGEDHEPPLRGL